MSDEIPHGDLVTAMRALAASNEKLCRIVLAADELAEAVGRFGERHFAIREALDAYKITRRGS